MTQMQNTVISLGKTKKTLLLAVGLIVALVVVLSMSNPDKSETFAQMPGMGKDAPPTPVRVETIETVEGTQPLGKVGQVMAKETVDLVPRVSGYLESVKFKEGDYVKKGDLLFEIEDVIYKINVRVAEAVIKQIEAEVELAKRNHERISELQLSRTSTKQEVDEALRGIAFQEGRLDEAKAKLDQARNDLGYTKIYAPLSGRIGAKQYSEGNYLTPQSGVLATIRQFDPISVVFPVDEKEFIDYFQGSRDTRIEVLTADRQPYQGEFEIDFINNQFETDTAQIMIYLLCKNPDTRLTPGNWIRVNLSENFEQPLPAVTVTALMTDGTHHYVYVVTKDNKIERRNVVIGNQVYDKQIITSGLNPGERVVVGGLNRIKPDDVVNPVEVPKQAIKESPAEPQPVKTDTSEPSGA